MDEDSTFGAYVIGTGEPWTPRSVIVGYMDDAAAEARSRKGTYIGPLPFLARYELPSLEGSDV
jgi:hypothetical protein